MLRSAYDSMSNLWFTIFVYPPLNAMVMLYETVAFGNLGVAVIELTIILRLVLFPFTIISERNEAKYERIEAEMEGLKRTYADDPVQLKECVRELLRTHRISPWAKMIVLVIQFLVLVGFYQVFYRGISASLVGLYPWVMHPQMPINTMFFGFDIAVKNFYWALAVGIVLYISVVIDQRKHEQILGHEDAVFRYAFPLFTVVLLSVLPMVKSIFVLTSMFFSIAVSFIRHRIWPTE